MTSTIWAAQKSSWLLQHLACPKDGLALVPTARERLACPSGHEYPVVDGIPVLLSDDLPATHPYRDETLSRIARGESSPAVGLDKPIDEYVQNEILKTNGNLYRHLEGKLPRYPIPELRLPPGNGQTLLDVGCNWGRWTFAAARGGYRAVGVDPWIDGARAGSRVAYQLGLDVAFVVGDARELPFLGASFDVAFSYSVLQHLDKRDARTSWLQLARVTKPGGTVLIQMPNIFGLRQAYNLLRQTAAEKADPFRVRYWTPRELLRVGVESVGPSTLLVDGFFSLNAQASDLDLMPPHLAWVIRASEILRRTSNVIPLLGRVADSLYVQSRRAP